MERLTERNENGKAITKTLEFQYLIDRLADYEDAEELCIEECGCCLRMVIKKYKEFLEDMVELAEYRQAEEQGLLLRLPCKVGSTVYVLIKLTNSGEWIVCPYEHRITDIFLNEKKEPLFKITNTYGTFKLSEFGKTVFLTREEAEQTLAEMQKG